jgi:hypothetical protein
MLWFPPPAAPWPQSNDQHCLSVLQKKGQREEIRAKKFPMMKWLRTKINYITYLYPDAASPALRMLYVAVRDLSAADVAVLRTAAVVIRAVARSIYPSGK